MVNRVLVLASVLVLSIIFGCAHNKELRKPLTAEEQYTFAQDKFNKKKYQESLEEFQRVIYNHPGSDRIDEARFGIAECYFYTKDYTLAASEYRYIVTNFSDSPYADDSQYKLGLCYYHQSPPAELDQELTYKAIEEFQIFLFDYPDSDLKSEVESKLLDCRNKLAKKEYKNGRLYLKQKEYYAAIMYFEEVLTRYHDTEWCDDAQFGIAESYYHQKIWDKSHEHYQKMITNYPQSPLTLEARKRIQQIQSKLTSESEVDS